MRGRQRNAGSGWGRVEVFRFRSSGRGPRANERWILPKRTPKTSELQPVPDSVFGCGDDSSSNTGGSGGSGATAGSGGSGGSGATAGSGGSGGTAGRGGSGGTAGSGGSGGAGGTGCSGNSCGPLKICDAGGACIDGARVFVSEARVNANLGGPTGADVRCQQWAADAGLSGNWLSWTSDLTTSPSIRFHKFAIPYRLLTGTRVADDWDDLSKGTIQAAINLTETRTTLAPGIVAWTNTQPTGVVTANSGGADERCRWLTSDNPALNPAIVGRVSSTNTFWSSWTNNNAGCSDLHHVYCFEQQ